MMSFVQYTMNDQKGYAHAAYDLIVIKGTTTKG